MTSLAIRHCDLVIRRTADAAAPWLDGDDHRALARRVQALVLPMLGELLAPRLARHEGTARRELRLHLALHSRDLAGPAPLARPALRARLAGAVDAALAEAAMHAAGLAPARRPDAEPVDAAPAPGVLEPPPSADPAIALPRLLDLLLPSAGPERALALLPLPDLARLVLAAFGRPAAPHRHLSPRARDQSPPAPGSDPTPDTAAARATLVAALRSLAAAGRDGRPATASASGDAAVLSLIRGILDRVDSGADTGTAGPAPPAPPTEAPSEADAPDRAARAKAPNAAARHPPPPAPAKTSPASAMPSAALAPGRHALDHALPFLALAVLVRHGIAAAMALDAGDAATGHALATAVALTTLPPASPSLAARGAGAAPPAMPIAERRSGARDAARAAGLAEAPDGAALLAAAARLGTGDLTRAAIAATLAGSLQPGLTLPLVAADGAVMLFDPGGLYPVAAGPPEQLADFLRETGRPLFLVPSDSHAWRVLCAAGLAMVAEGPALPGEPGRPLAGHGGWRGHGSPRLHIGAAARARLPEEAATAARAAEVWQALCAPLPLLAHPVPRVRPLQSLAALLAGFALADMGWALYRHDPASWTAPDPLLVRDRFGDLSGWLEVAARSITVVLPLGRRFTDLRAAGLLDTVRAVPWWPGREIAFRGG